MTANADRTPVARPSRLRRAVGWVPLLAFCGLSLVGYRWWSDHLRQSPVAEVHARYLDFLAERSAQASAYRDAYYGKFGRDSVASEHFEQVCATMLRLALQDQVDPAAHSAPMAPRCSALGRKYPGLGLPG